MTYTVQELIARLKEFPDNYTVHIKGHFVGLSDLLYITAGQENSISLHIAKPQPKTSAVKGDKN